MLYLIASCCMLYLVHVVLAVADATCRPACSICYTCVPGTRCAAVCCNVGSCLQPAAGFLMCAGALPRADWSAPMPHPPLPLQTGRNVVHGSDSPENGERETGASAVRGLLHFPAACACVACLVCTACQHARCRCAASRPIHEASHPQLVFTLPLASPARLRRAVVCRPRHYRVECAHAALAGGVNTQLLQNQISTANAACPANLPCPAHPPLVV